MTCVLPDTEEQVQPRREDQDSIDVSVEHYAERLRIVDVRLHWTAPGGWAPACYVYHFEVYISIARRGRGAPEWGVDGVIARDGFPDVIMGNRMSVRRDPALKMLRRMLNDKVRHDVEFPVQVTMRHMVDSVMAEHGEVKQSVDGTWKQRQPARNGGAA